MVDILNAQNPRFIGTYTTPNPPHRHTKWELVIFEEGTMQNHINDVVYEAVPGSVFLIGPQHQHAISGNNVHLHQDIYIEEADLRHILSIYPSEFRNSVLAGNIVRLQLSESDLKSIVKKIGDIENLSLIPITKMNDKQLIKSLTLSITQYILGIYLSDNYLQQIEYPAWFLQFQKRISSPENFTKSVSELIAETGYSHTHFGILFKKSSGISLVEYLKQIRLSYAAELLLTTDYTTLFICENCGYTSYSYFVREFKKKYSFTPTQYRKRKKDGGGGYKNIHPFTEP